MVRLLRFDFQPMTRACLLVLAHLHFRNNTLEPVLLDRIEKVDAVFFHVVCKAYPPLCTFQQLLQDSFPLDKWKLHEVVAIQVKQIERIEVNRNLLIRDGDVLRPRQMNARLNKTEMSLSFLIQRHNFSVEHGGVRRQIGKGFSECRKSMIETFPVTSPHLELRSVFYDKGTHTVEF